MAKQRFMSLDALSRTSEFRALSIRQQLFVQSLVSTIRDCGAPDKLFAVQSGFGVDGEIARVMANQLVRKPKVLAAIRVWRNFGKSEKRIALDDVRADIKASRPGSPARARLREIEAKLLSTKTKRKSR